MLTKLSADIVICVALYLYQNCHDVTRLKLLCKDINALLKKNRKFKTDYSLLHSQYSKEQDNMWKCKAKENPDAFDNDWEQISVTRYIVARKMSRLSIAWLQESGPSTPYIYSTNCTIQFDAKIEFEWAKTYKYYPLFLCASKIFLQRIQKWESKAAEKVFKTFAQKRRFKSLVTESESIKLLIPTNQEVCVWTEEKKLLDTLDCDMESVLKKGQKVLFIGEVSGYLTEGECGFRINAKHIMMVSENHTHLCKRHCS